MKLFKFKSYQFLVLSVFGGVIFTSCLKEDLSKKTDIEQRCGESEVKEFSEIIQISNASNSNSFLNLKISSVDSLYTQRLVSYYSKLEVDFVDVNSESFKRSQDSFIKPDNFPSDSIGHSLHLDWSNFPLSDRAGGEKRLQQLVFINEQANSEKSWTTIDFYDLNNISTSGGFAYVRLWNQTSYWQLGCLCTKTGSYWKFAWDQNGVDDFYTPFLENINDLAATVSIDCPNTNDHVRIHNTFPTSMPICPSTPSQSYADYVTGNVDPQIITNNIKSVRGTVGNFNIDHKAKADIRVYYWI